MSSVIHIKKYILENDILGELKLLLEDEVLQPEPEPESESESESAIDYLKNHPLSTIGYSTLAGVGAGAALSLYNQNKNAYKGTINGNYLFAYPGYKARIIRNNIRRNNLAKKER